MKTLNGVLDFLRLQMRISAAIEAFRTDIHRTNRRGGGGGGGVPDTESALQAY